MKSTDNTFSFDNAEDSTGFLLWQVTNLWQREIKKALARTEALAESFELIYEELIRHGTLPRPADHP